MTSTWFHWFGFRGVLVGTAALVAVLTALPGLFRAGTPFWVMFLLLGLGGFVRATQFTTCNALSYAEIDQSRVTAASTLQSVIQQLGIAAGITFGGLALHLAQGSGGPLTPDHFILPFCLVGLLSLLAVPVYLGLHREVGADMAGRRRAHG